MDNINPTWTGEGEGVVWKLGNFWTMIFKVVHVVWDFRPWDVMTKVHYFLMLLSQFSGPWDTQRVKIQVDQGLWLISRSCSTSIESSNYQLEPSKNNLLSSLRPMDKSFISLLNCHKRSYIRSETRILIEF